MPACSRPPRDGYLFGCREELTAETPCGHESRKNRTQIVRRSPDGIIQMPCQPRFIFGKVLVGWTIRQKEEAGDSSGLSRCARKAVSLIAIRLLSPRSCQMP